MNEPNYQLLLEQMPKPPEGSSFSVQKIEKISIPHPFVITPRHVAYAADHCSGRLGEETTNAIPCGWRGCSLYGKDHKSQLTAFILVPQNDNLNKVEGLHAYLLSVKEWAEKNGIQGFAFPRSRIASVPTTPDDDIHPLLRR